MTSQNDDSKGFNGIEWGYSRDFFANTMSLLGVSENVAYPGTSGHLSFRQIRVSQNLVPFGSFKNHVLNHPHMMEMEIMISPVS